MSERREVGESGGKSVVVSEEHGRLEGRGRGVSWKAVQKNGHVPAHDEQTGRSEHTNERAESAKSERRRQKDSIEAKQEQIKQQAAAAAAQVQQEAEKCIANAEKSTKQAHCTHERAAIQCRCAAYLVRLLGENSCDATAAAAASNSISHNTGTTASQLIHRIAADSADTWALHARRMGSAAI
jgi:hypothetical protein